jgi:hypothetical protein
LSPTRPLLQSRVPAHSTQSWKSRVSRGENGSTRPGERPVPRESTRTHAYPCGTHFSGSTTSQFWYVFEVPVTVSGWSRAMASQALG